MVVVTFPSCVFMVVFTLSKETILEGRTKRSFSVSVSSVELYGGGTTLAW